MPKHFMRIRDLGHSGAWEIIRRAKEMKETNYRGHCMDGKVAALIFEKASTRTRGDRLFEANLLILRCFLDTLGFSLHEPLLLRGVERPTDLLHSQAIAQIERFGLEAAEQATRFYHE